MKSNETHRYEMFLRVDEYGTNRAAQFPAATLANDLYRSLHQIIAELNEHAMAQSTGRRAARESSGTKAAARDELMRDLEAISRTARALALTAPGLEDKFRIPRNLKDRELLTLARSFAQDALTLKTEFIRFGLASDFLEDLNADIAEFEEALERRNQGRETHVTATAAIDDLIERGMKVVRQLDTVMRNTYANNPAELAAWLSASHVERSRRAARPAAPTPTPAN